MDTNKQQTNKHKQTNKHHKQTTQTQTTQTQTQTTQTTMSDPPANQRSCFSVCVQIQIQKQHNTINSYDLQLVVVSRVEFSPMGWNLGFGGHHWC